MSGNFTRIGLDEDAEASGTDWKRLKDMDDVEIDAAIAADGDSYAVTAPQVLGHAGASYRYVLHAGPQGEWRWQLVDANGEILAESGHGFPTRDAAAEAIQVLRQAMVGARAAA